MSIIARRPWLRWLVPAAATVAVIGGGAAVRAVSAAADPTLPPRTAAQLLVDLQNAAGEGFSGTVTQRADLGLPALPNVATQSSTDLWSLVSGAHTLRVWYSGPENARVALLGTLGETDVIKFGRDLWIWDSRDNTATHSTLPERQSGDPADRSAAPSPVPTGPKEIADLALKAIDPTTKVSTAGSTRVAGRSAYELILTPRDTDSLVGQLRFAIDAERHIPLRAQVWAKDAKSAVLDAAFTQVSFARPDAAQFRFNPPPGAKIIEEGDPAKADGATGSGNAEPARHPATAVIGTGWAQVHVLRLPDETWSNLKELTGSASGAPNGDRRSTDRAADPGAPNAEADRVQRQFEDQAASILGTLPELTGPWGKGRVLSCKLFSVLLTDDGRLLVGAVRPDRLATAAGDPAAAVTSGG